MTPGDRIQFHYKFIFPNNIVKTFEVELDGQTLAVQTAPKDSYPEWTRLSHRQCTNCPLREETHPRCPVAQNLVDIIEFFKHVVSHEEVNVEISTDARTYKKRTAVQNALSSLIGIYMVTSGCPILDKLSPLVGTHLPFASLEEPAYRAISM